MWRSRPRAVVERVALKTMVLARPVEYVFGLAGATYAFEHTIIDGIRATDPLQRGLWKSLRRLLKPRLTIPGYVSAGNGCVDGLFPGSTRHTLRELKNFRFLTRAIR
jgi:hypothetical protein